VATIRKREGRRGITWQAIVRKKDCRPITRSFRLKRNAEAWATSVEDAVNKDEYTVTSEARKHTIRDMLER